MCRLRAYTGRVKPWIAYSLARVGVFALALIVLMLLAVPWWAAAPIAAVIGLCVGFIFFGKLRDAVALDIVARRSAPEKDADSVAEDA